MCSAESAGPLQIQQLGVRVMVERSIELQFQLPAHLYRACLDRLCAASIPIGWYWFRLCAPALGLKYHARQPHAATLQPRFEFTIVKFLCA